MDPSEPQDLTALTLAELSNLEVSVLSRRVETRNAAPAAVSVLTFEYLDRWGVTTLADALSLVPGVTVGRVDSSGWAVGIRGFTSRLARAQLVLIDGRSVYNPLFAGTYWETQDTLLEDVSRIEVVRGPGGTLWGANAVNGIVSVVTRPASETPGGLLALTAGSEELSGALRYGGRLGAKGAYRAYAKASAREASYHADGSAYDDWRLADGGFRSDFELAKGRRLTVSGDLYSGRVGQRSRLTSYSPPYLRDVDGDASVEGGDVLARFEGGASTIQAYLTRTDRDEARFGEARNTLDLDVQRSFNPLGRHRLVGGFGYRRSAGDSHGSPSAAMVPAYRVDDLVTGFLQDDVTLAGGKVRLAAGVKVEHNDYTGFEWQPSLRALHALSARHSVWLAATRAVRTPSRVEHDIDVSVAGGPALPIFLRWLGDAGFQSETLQSYEAGYRAELGGSVTFDLAAFHNRYDNLLGLEPGTISVEPTRVVATVFTGNSLEARSTGFETSFAVRPISRWLLRGDYSYLSLVLDRRPGSKSLTAGDDEEGSSPRHQLHLRSAVGLSSRVEVSASFRWVDGLAAQKVPAYSELDGRAAWRPSSSFELAVVGRNLLHRRHLEFVGDAPIPSEIERAVLATLRLRW